MSPRRRTPFLISSRNHLHARRCVGGSRVLRAWSCSLSTPLPLLARWFDAFKQRTASSSPSWGHAPKTSLVPPVETAECGIWERDLEISARVTERRTQRESMLNRNKCTNVSISRSAPTHAARSGGERMEIRRERARLISAAVTTGHIITPLWGPTRNEATIWQLILDTFAIHLKHRVALSILVVTILTRPDPGVFPLSDGQASEEMLSWRQRFPRTTPRCFVRRRWLSFSPGKGSDVKGAWLLPGHQNLAWRWTCSRAQAAKRAAGWHSTRYHENAG
jgi:hypothetical protein